jgi:hypothetical protein
MNIQYLNLKHTSHLISLRRFHQNLNDVIFYDTSHNIGLKK